MYLTSHGLMPSITAMTVLAVMHNGSVVIGADGQANKSSAVKKDRAQTFSIFFHSA